MSCTCTGYHHVAHTAGALHDNIKKVYLRQKLVYVRGSRKHPVILQEKQLQHIQDLRTALDTWAAGSLDALENGADGTDRDKPVVPTLKTLIHTFLADLTPSEPLNPLLTLDEGLCQTTRCGVPMSGGPPVPLPKFGTVVTKKRFFPDGSVKVGAPSPATGKRPSVFMQKLNVPQYVKEVIFGQAVGDTEKNPKNPQIFFRKFLSYLVFFSPICE